jgi:hypothetical protein
MAGGRQMASFDTQTARYRSMLFSLSVAFGFGRIYGRNFWPKPTSVGH